jgi:hypothetical protein
MIEVLTIVLICAITMAAWATWYYKPWKKRAKYCTGACATKRCDCEGGR